MTARTPIRRDPLAFEEIRALVGRDDPVILEIGANNGQDSRQFLATFPACRLFCFEPDPRPIATWRRKVRDRRATLIETAVGAVDGKVPFHASTGVPGKGDWDKSGSIRAPTGHIPKHPSVLFRPPVEIPCTRLDTWLAGAGIDRIDFIWADVQGAEIDLIRGAPQALAITRFLYTEYSNIEFYAGQGDLTAILALLPGFRIELLFREDVLLRRVS